MSLGAQALVTLLLPLAAALVDVHYDEPVAERHHGHHDTYVVSRFLLSSLGLSMAFMGVLGPVLSWLCVHGVFSADARVVLSYFTTVVLVAFFFWALIRRYRIVTYQDRLMVHPLVGRARTVVYAEIDRMEWVPSLFGRRTPSVRVWEADSAICTLWGAMDLDQILLRVDRFDAFGQDGGGR